MQYEAIVLALALSVALALPQNNLKLVKPIIPRRGAETGGSRLGIFGGQTTTINKYPHLVSLVTQSTQFCAGVILGSHWVFTCGDCLYGLTESDLTVVAGSNNGVNGTAYSVTKLVLHPSYSYGSSFYDYGLVRVKEPFAWGDTIANVSLPSKRPRNKEQFMVAGWGYKDYLDGTSTSSLLEGMMRWQSNGTCEYYYEPFYGWDASESCASNWKKVTLCHGDFGDPFVKNGVVYGVFIGGASAAFCTKYSSPAVIADALTVVDWLQQHTGATIAQS